MAHASLRPVLALLVLLAGALAPGAGTRAEGAAPASVADERVRLALLAGWREGEGARVAGLRIELAGEWKTYWRVPGEAGIPPLLDWSRSSNLAALRVRWPAPTSFETWGMRSYGYAHAVTLPLELRAEDPARPVHLVLDAMIGLCAEICVPAAATLALEIAPEALDGAPEISAGLSALPVAAAEAGVELERCALTGEGAARRFTAVFRLPEAPRGVPLAVVEGPEAAPFGPAETRLEGRVLTVSAAPAEGAGWIGREDLRVTLIGPGAGAVEWKGCR